MPTYTYECKKCGETQDEFHGISAKPRVKCNACGGACKRLLGTGSGIIFKGSGFYETDFKQKSGKPEAGESKKSDSSDKKESKSPTESKSPSESKSSGGSENKKSTAASGKKD